VVGGNQQMVAGGQNAANPSLQGQPMQVQMAGNQQIAGPMSQQQPGVQQLRITRPTAPRTMNPNMV